MKPTGVLFICVTEYENLDKTVENEMYDSEIKSGIHSVIRLYGRDFSKRMGNAGFDVKKINVSELCTDEEISNLYLEKKTNIYICQKK